VDAADGRTGAMDREQIRHFEPISDGFGKKSVTFLAPNGLWSCAYILSRFFLNFTNLPPTQAHTNGIICAHF
jgi:hypothetical protein